MCPSVAVLQIKLSLSFFHSSPARKWMQIARSEFARSRSLCGLIKWAQFKVGLLTRNLPTSWLASAVDKEELKNLFLSNQIVAHSPALNR